MPTYSYRCRDCDTAFDIQQSFTDDTLTECPSCGGRLRKVFSPVGVTFNGSGFYRTDSRSKGSGAGSGGESSGASGETGGSGPSTSSGSTTSEGSGGSSAGTGGASSSSGSTTKAPAVAGG